MKPIYIVLLFLFFHSYVFAQEDKKGKYTYEQWEVFGDTLYGKVKSVERVHYMFEEVNGAYKKRLPNERESNSKNEHCQYFFDEEANIVAYQVFDTLGKVYYKQLYTYNEDLLPTTVETFLYQDNKEVGHLVTKNTYHNKGEIALKENFLTTFVGKKKTYRSKEIVLFNDKDLKKSISEYSKNKLYAKTTFSYDDKGNMIKEQYKNFKDKDENKTTLYTYDTKGQLLIKEEIVLGEISYFETFAYLSNGKVWKETSYDIHKDEKDLKRNEKVTYYIYDPDGNVVEEQTLHSGDFKMSFSYCYTNGQQKEEYIYANGQLRDVTFFTHEGGKMTRQERFSLEGKLLGGAYYTYDARGNCLLAEYKSYNERTKTFETTGETLYKYDAHNNCIYKADFFDGKPKYLIERTFIYYE